MGKMALIGINYCLIATSLIKLLQKNMFLSIPLPNGVIVVLTSEFWFVAMAAERLNLRKI